VKIVNIYFKNPIISTVNIFYKDDLHHLTAVESDVELGAISERGMNTVWTLKNIRK